MKRKITEIFCKRRVHRKNKGPFAIGRGKPLPLGAQITVEGVNFAVFSRHATAMTLLLFQEHESQPLERLTFDPVLNRTGDIWHMLVYELDPRLCYAYQADGPYQPQQGHRFDPHCLLLDPYAKALSGGKIWGQVPPLPRYSRIVCDEFDWAGDVPPAIALQDSIIYELHVRNYTIDPSSGVKAPGTFLGLTEKIPYLQRLGITAVELMPICEFNENENFRHNPFTKEKLKNVWGYSSIAFWAPKASYAQTDPVSEFKEMVKRFHRAGLEVILDVVFNHTAEGHEQGPTLNFKGLDNAIYYMLGSRGEYLNFSGCGNTLNCNHPLIRDLILDCLRYWVTEMHVDGFRFDLAAILGRGRQGEVLSNPPLIERIAADPVLASTKIIAEAWDAAGLYQVGRFPAWGRWAEWNGKYRDEVRQAVRGDPGRVAQLATRLTGSSDLYQWSNRPPYHSINFITSHDGFTLADLVSYNNKHNLANGEGNHDGTDHNYSWNCGVEGPTDDPAVLALRRRQVRNFFTILLLSQGVPMILGGDEFGRTQQGNNNAYCQDNAIAWVDWRLAEENAGFLRFCREMIAFRKAHPILRRSLFFQGRASAGGLADITWHGVQLEQPDWGAHSRSLAFLLAGDQALVAGEPDNDIYVALNFYHQPLSFALPQLAGKEWYRVVDTARAYPLDIMPPGTEPRLVDQNSYTLAPYSVIVLLSRPHPAR